jgi:hypothetical protein
VEQVSWKAIREAVQKACGGVEEPDRSVPEICFSALHTALFAPPKENAQPNKARTPIRSFRDWWSTWRTRWNRRQGRIELKPEMTEETGDSTASVQRSPEDGFSSTAAVRLPTAEGLPDSFVRDLAFILKELEMHPVAAVLAATAFAKGGGQLLFEDFLEVLNGTTRCFQYQRGGREEMVWEVRLVGKGQAPYLVLTQVTLPPELGEGFDHLSLQQKVRWLLGCIKHADQHWGWPVQLSREDRQRLERCMKDHAGKKIRFFLSL